MRKKGTYEIVQQLSLCIEFVNEPRQPQASIPAQNDKGVIFRFKRSLQKHHAWVGNRDTWED